MDIIDRVRHGEADPMLAYDTFWKPRQEDIVWCCKKIVAVSQSSGRSSTGPGRQKLQLERLDHRRLDPKSLKSKSLASSGRNRRVGLSNVLGYVILGGAYSERTLAEGSLARRLPESASLGGPITIH